MAEENLSAVLYGVNDIRLEQREVPIPAANQLLISVNTVGICGSDVHFWKNGAIGNFVVKEPMVLGHETCGTVAGVGAHVKGFSVGDRIAIEPGIPCRECEYCKIGRYNLCPEVKFFATPPTHGSLARYIVHDADFCYKCASNTSELLVLVLIVCVDGGDPPRSREARGATAPQEQEFRDGSSVALVKKWTRR
ncbi:hypothetical protein Y032_0034g2911 [Ancylostoma ceylanicum]|uniref:Sorbitol dehydrogenase n=1 Tax=Ancylostoma ceylanicum TaxID=53326 RepID=A0A016UMZ7_9BILA|nr:hypothetical protein Y032_0034g2911 [Ancylostoma ceylanicum]